MSNLTPLSLACIAGISAFLSPQFALAEEAPSAHTATGESAAPLADIIVTAQRREERSRDTPVSVTSLSGERLARAHIRDATDLVAQVPGFTLARSFRGPPIFTLRGVGFNSQNMSATSPVGFALDDMALPFPAMAEGVLFDLDRVEVLKGPQGTLFGRNTTGGLVNNIARKPTRQTDGYLTLSGGSYESYGTQGALAGPLTKTLSARLAFSIERADKGWQQSITRGDRLGKKDKAAARLSLLWEPSAGTELLLTGNWWRDRSDTQAPQSVEMHPNGLIAAGFIDPADWPLGAALFGLPGDYLDQSFTPTHGSQANWAVGQLPWGGAVGGQNYTPAPLDFRKHNNFRSLALRGSFRLNDHLKLETLSSHALFRRNEVTDNAGWAYENAITRSRGRIESTAQEVRLLGEHDRFNWVLGSIYTIDSVDDRDEAWVGTNSLLALFRAGAAQTAADAGADIATQEDALFGFRDYANDTHQTSRSFALYGQASYRPEPAFGLTFGLRYTRDRTRFAGCSRDMGDNSLAATVNAFWGGLANVVPGGCTTFLADMSQGLVEDRLAEENVSGRFALDWRVARDTMLYASIARGFKSGTFPNIEGNFAVQYVPARQEEVWSYEVGVKSRPWRWLSLDAAAFYSDYRNKQLFGAIEDPVFGTLARVLNMPRSEIAGLEASIIARPARKLTLETNLAWLHSRVNQFIGLNDFGLEHDYAGASFVYTPHFQINSRIEQGFALPAGWQGQASLAWRYSSTQRGDMQLDPRYLIASNHVFDAMLAFRSPHSRYQVDIFVKNLTDRYYWNAIHLQGDSFERYAAMPRTWGISLTRQF